MTTAQSIKIASDLGGHNGEAATPTTPRAPPYSPGHVVPETFSEPSAASVPTTPTTSSFSGLIGQRPLPRSPFRNSFSSLQRPIIEDEVDVVEPSPSNHSVQPSNPRDIDVDMDESDDGNGGSDADSIDAETGRPSKKKKGQRFFCTDYPPCKLSFTRSEHLARHIRKHTGERPFACHCSRRFSRLDNLRQHAQTVHVNEEIPGDSLAATGTRFQRQIRTDKVVRPNSSRSRASTASSQGSHSRTHGRNLSTSSIGSIASTISRDDSRRRPTPLIMANDPASRARMSLEILRSGASTPPGQGSFYRESSEGLSTPTSVTFSTGQNSPGCGSSVGSPMSAVSRNGGSFWDSRSHLRRLSVPSGPAPFQLPHGNAYGSPYLSPLASSTASTFSNLSGSSTSVAQTLSGRDSAESDLRRRTWHPNTYYTSLSRPATSGLSYYQTPDALRPALVPQAIAAAGQPHRLPGIETFDQAPQHTQTSSALSASPRSLGNTIKPTLYPGSTVPSSGGAHDRRGHASWDMSLHQNLTKLDIATGSSSKEPEIWSQYNQQSVQTPLGGRRQQPLQESPAIHQKNQTRLAEHSDNPATSANRSKRQGWYAGPPASGVQTTVHTRNSPGTSSSSEGVPTTPSLPYQEHVPSIRHSNGLVEATLHAAAGVSSPNTSEYTKPAQPPLPLPTEPHRQRYDPSKDTEMTGLEVLVAVATREENAVTTPHTKISIV